jgi:hypothetical protein
MKKIMDLVVRFNAWMDTSLWAEIGAILLLAVCFYFAWIITPH